MIFVEDEGELLGRFGSAGLLHYKNIFNTPTISLNYTHIESIGYYPRRLTADDGSRSPLPSSRLGPLLSYSPFLSRCSFLLELD